MQYWSLEGTTSYERASALQKSLVDLRAAGAIPDTVLFLEHDPVVTRGRGLQYTGEKRERHVELPKLPEGISFAESERGGDLTYHGPGQLVIYPIFKLDGEGFGPRHDVAGFLRQMERMFLDELAVMGLHAESRENATGVWVGEKKVASIGIAVRKWVTYHGIAINVVNDLRPFLLFQPCGFQGEVMTRLQDLLGESLPEGLREWGHWRAWLEERLAARFDSGLPHHWVPSIQNLKIEEAESRVSAWLASPGLRRLNDASSVSTQESV
jgi:lipoyl(octanoyl) transferase